MPEPVPKSILLNGGIWMKKWICVFTGIAVCVLLMAGALSAGNKSIAIIGGADGPTSVFIAGNPSSASSAFMIVIEIIIILGTAIIVVRNLNHRK